MGGETNTVRETAEEEPLSPCSQLFNSPDFNCAIIVTMGCKVKGNPSAIIDGLKHTLVNHPRFSSILARRLEAPPGFPPLFPELQGEERTMALQYISHADETERRARIMRVQQSIEADKDNPPAVLIKISHEVDKEKGHVFQYDKPASEALPLVCKRAHPTLSAPSGDRNRGFNEGSSSGESANSRSVPKGPTVFQAGIFCSTSTGTFQNKKKKSRQRPPAWVRHVRPARSSTCVNLSVTDEPEMKNGKKGQPSWVRTKVRVEEHVIVPDIDPDIENPYQYVEDYISNLTTVPMDLSKPLWEIHLLCLKTSNAESIGLLKIHHSLGDGMSLMSLFLACTRKTSDPEALPTVAVQKKTVWTDLLQWDTETPLLAKPGCELKPKRFVHRIISFDDVKLVKNAMNMCSAHTHLKKLLSSVLQSRSRSNTEIQRVDEENPTSFSNYD
ncbi:hypothetical protein F2Q69_00043524 [Brassica cretica]|uniref:diacylglycerol O-acyltransferase n=1 Tax=Brassica cretica TaxID=69181 RepID=A0A8S9N8Q1_BRACR|nr:hypothetical protein F2Q69_00043524 [Brassica cretica]